MSRGGGLARAHGWPLDHIGVAVADLDAAVARWAWLGFWPERIEDVPGDHIRVAFLPWDAGELELMAPVGPEGTVARFLAKRGPGLHHLAFRVDHLADVLQQLAADGVRLVDAVPRPGSRGTRVAFLHPSACEGVLTELVEAPHGR